MARSGRPPLETTAAPEIFRIGQHLDLRADLVRFRMVRPVDSEPQPAQQPRQLAQFVALAHEAEEDFVDVQRIVRLRFRFRLRGCGCFQGFPEFFADGLGRAFGRGAVHSQSVGT